MIYKLLIPGGNAQTDRGSVKEDATEVHWYLWTNEVGLPVSWLVDCVTDGVVVKFAVVDFTRVVGAWVITVWAGVESFSVVVCVVEGCPDVCACVVTVCVVEGFPVVCACVVTVCVVKGVPEAVAARDVTIFVDFPVVVCKTVVAAWVVDELNICVVDDIVDVVYIKIIFYSLGVVFNEKKLTWNLEFQ